MSSDSPSGGMKEIVRSLSKRERRTHWWNFTSSIITVFPLSPEEHNMISGTNVHTTKAHRCRWMWLSAGGRRTSSETKQHSIVEAQPQFRHPREHGFQLDAAHDVTAHHIAIRIHLRTHGKMRLIRFIKSIKQRGWKMHKILYIQYTNVVSQKAYCYYCR